MTSKTRFFERYENDVDKYGFNLASSKNVEPFIKLISQRWFGVKIANIENIPSQGNAVLFGNHSGVLPIDGCLLYDGIINYHPNPRRVRYLVTKFLLKTPLVGKFLKGFGCVPPAYEVATDLLRAQELVYFYPEAEKGTGKLFKNRYKLVDFHAGFVRAALETASPMVSVVTIGGDEIYPLLGNIEPLAKILKAPYFPVTPLFPWLPFPLNAIPLPIKLLICVFPAFRLKYPPEAADDENLVAEIVSDIRSDVQSKIDELLAIRTSPFSRWNMDAVNAYLKNTGSTFAASERHFLKG